MTPEVIGLGAMNLDRLLRVSTILQEGEAPVEEMYVGPGGSAANTIYALARLGISTGFIGAVGDDGEGRELVSALSKAGVDVSPIAIKPGSPTGTILGLVDNRGRRTLYPYPGANALLAREDIDIDYVNQASYLHLSSFVQEEQLRLQLEIVKGLSPPVRLSLAPGALYARQGLEALQPLLKRSHILFLNRSEMEELTGKDYRAGARQLAALGCPLVVVTLGGEGKGVAHIQQGEREYLIEARSRPRVVDSTGAGDAFAAGFLFGLLQGEPLVTSARYGEVMATFCLAKMGARPGLPTRPQLLSRFRRLKP